MIWEYFRYIGARLLSTHLLHALLCLLTIYLKPAWVSATYVNIAKLSHCLSLLFSCLASTISIQCLFGQVSHFSRGPSVIQEVSRSLLTDVNFSPGSPLLPKNMLSLLHFLAHVFLQLPIRIYGRGTDSIVLFHDGKLTHS